jgi:hypothetical protein
MVFSLFTLTVSATNITRSQLGAYLTELGDTISFEEEDWRAGFEEFLEAFADAFNVFMNSRAAQAQINEAYENLIIAVDGLVPMIRPDMSRSALLALINTRAPELEGDPEGYTTQSWNEFMNAFITANTVALNSRSPQADITEAYWDLYDAKLVEDDGSGGSASEELYGFYAIHYGYPAGFEPEDLGEINEAFLVPKPPSGYELWFRNEGKLLSEEGLVVDCDDVIVLLIALSRDNDSSNLNWANFDDDSKDNPNSIDMIEIFGVVDLKEAVEESDLDEDFLYELIVIFTEGTLILPGSKYKFYVKNPLILIDTLGPDTGLDIRIYTPTVTGNGMWRVLVDGSTLTNPGVVTWEYDMIEIEVTIEG